MAKSYIEYESTRDGNKTLSVEEYLNKTRSYLKDIINDLKKSNTRKIQLTIAINVISSKENDEKCAIPSNSDSIKIMINDMIKQMKLKKNFFNHFFLGIRLG